MPGAWTNEELKSFIRQTLGCGCADKVFEKIEVSGHQMQEIAVDYTRIVVGDKLLIYVIHSNTDIKPSWNVESMGKTGKQDRDRNRYNRFRLVLPVGHDIGQFEARFSNVFPGDKKMHIHFVDRELLSGL